MNVTNTASNVTNASPPDAFLRVFNPILRTMLKTPLGGITPSQLVVLSYTGRKSGKPYETIVTGYRKGNMVAIALGHGKTDWVKNVLAAGEADLREAGCGVWQA